MASLFNTRISDTYQGLIKTIDNAAITATLKELTDGSGNSTGISLNNAGDFKVNAILEFGSLKDTGENIIITKFVDEADGIANNDNDTSIPTTAAIVDYVAAQITIEDLDFTGDTGSGQIDLDSQIFAIGGTTNEITTVASGQSLTLSLDSTGVNLPDNSTAITQTAGDNSTKIATTSYVDTLDSASDLDFSGDSGTGDVNLNTQTLAVTGTANQIESSASGQGLSLQFPTAGITLPNGSVATTQSAGDNSTKVATTSYVDTLDAASDLDITDGTNVGDINLNTQSLSILGTTNEIDSVVSGQSVTLGLPSSISTNLVGDVTGNLIGNVTGDLTGNSAGTHTGAVVGNVTGNLTGNVTGDLTGNSDTATAWETARDLSLTGQATGTISSVDGTNNVSGAVTLDNNSVTAKVLTGLPSPSASSVLATDTIVEGIGKLQSQVNGLAGGLRFIGSWDADTNSPVLSDGGGEAANGTTTSTTANKLVDSTASFTTTVTVGDQVVNQVDGTTALVTNIDSDTTLSLDGDIMLSGEAYTIDNSPFITQGHYYVVSVGGTTSLNGVSNWTIGDWVIAGANNEWTKLDHSQVDGTGTTGNLTKWSSTSVIADSIVSESGSAITVDGSLTTNTNLSSTGNFAVNTDKFTVAASSGNTAFTGDLAINTDKFTVNATTGNVAVAGDVGLLDNKKLKIGTGSDIQIFHDTSYNFIDAYNQDLHIRSMSPDKGIFFLADNGSGGISPYFKVDGNAVETRFFKSTRHFDDVGAYFGDSADLQIYHDGSNSYIQDIGTGRLIIKSDYFEVDNAAGTEAMIEAIQDGAVNLYYNASKKFETTSTGVSVTGNVEVRSGNKLILQRPDNAVSTEIHTDSTGAMILNSINDEGFFFNNNGTNAFKLDPINATFAGQVNITSSGAAHFSITNTNVSGSSQQYLQYVGSNGDYVFRNATDATTPLSLAKNNNATFSGNVALTSALPLLYLTNTTSGTGKNWRLSSATNGKFFISEEGIVDAITLEHTSGNATFAGNVATSGQITVPSGYSVNIGSSRIHSTDTSYLLGGNVGLGTNSIPSDHKLQIHNAGGAFARFALTNSVSGVASGDGLKFQLENLNAIIKNQENGYLAFGTNGRETDLRIDSSGNVGIGTDSPVNNLQVKTGSNGGGITIQRNSSTNGSFADLMFSISTSDAASPETKIRATRGASYDDTDILFITSNTEKMRIDGSGNVGIGVENADIFGRFYGRSVGIGGAAICKLQLDGTSYSGIDLGKGGTRYGEINANDTGLDLSALGATTLKMYTNAIERMRITSGGAVEIGPAANKVIIKSQSSFQNTTLESHIINADGTGSYGSGDLLIQPRCSSVGSNNIIFGTSGGTNTTSEKMRITSGGEVLISATSYSDAGNNISLNQGLVKIGSATTASTVSMYFTNPNGVVGSVITSGSNTQFNTSSDYRLKEDLQDFAGLDMVSKIPVYDFKWKSDESRSYGVMAHELQEVLPDAVSGEKDAEEMQGVDYSKIVPLLVKSIQELTAKVDKLEQECKCKN